MNVEPKRSRKISLFEDEPVVAKLLEQLITQYGHKHIVTAKTMEEALAHIDFAATTPDTVDTIITDANLDTSSDGRDGEVIVRRTRTKLPGVTVVCFSGRHELAEADANFLKPDFHPLFKYLNEPDEVS
ncbi:MAG: response regulator [bacterium]|nr:response regulator [bacterium]